MIWSPYWPLRVDDIQGRMQAYEQGQTCDGKLELLIKSGTCHHEDFQLSSDSHINAERLAPCNTAGLLCAFSFASLISLSLSSSWQQRLFNVIIYAIDSSDRRFCPATFHVCKSWQ